MTFVVSALYRCFRRHRGPSRLVAMQMQAVGGKARRKGLLDLPKSLASLGQEARHLAG